MGIIGFVLLVYFGAANLIVRYCDPNIAQRILIVYIQCVSLFGIVLPSLAIWVFSRHAIDSIYMHV